MKTGNNTKGKPGDDILVNEFMSKLVHPLKAEIVALRNIIKNANNKIAEWIKWNAPSYYYKEDLLTFNPRMTNKVHLVFQNIAITKVKSDMLEGDYKDRRMMYFENMGEIKSKKKELERIINEYVKIIDKIELN